MSVKVPETAVLPLTPEQERVRAAKEEWRTRAAAAFAKTPAWRKDFTTVSSAEVNPLATPDDLAGFDYARDLGWPGEFPYTRGVQPTMYRGKPWTIRQFAGFGTARQTNERFKQLLAHGQTGLSTAFHLPTLYGYDSDHKMSAGEVGKCGVAVDTLRDFEVLFDGIDLGAVTTSMTINSTAPIALAMYLAVAEKHGTPWAKVGGTLQNDILKEYIAQKEYIFPPRPSMRLVTDQFAFCAKHVPRWNTVSISGYHIREAGATALQELAFTLRDGMEYVKYGVDAGLDVDAFAPRLSFFFNAHNDFFEEIAKYRAARRIWAKVMRDRYGAKKAESWKMRFHSQTAGVSLTAQQPYNNVARVAIQSLAAVLGGTQLPAHERARRDARAPDGVRREDRRPDAAGHPARDGRRQHDRPARRLVLRRGAHEPDGGGRIRLLPADRRLRRHGRGDRGRLPAEGDHGRRVPLPARVRREGQGDGRARTPSRSPFRRTRSRPS